MTVEEKKVFEDALHVYGKEAQITMVFEEMSELQKALCKFLRGITNPTNLENIAEEIADVEIMLDQMKLCFDCGDDVEKVRAKKVDRLKKRLEEAAYEDDPFYCPWKSRIG